MKMNNTEKPDSIIFDLDGTLWDALDTYVESWNEGFKSLNIDKRLKRDDISYMMGWEGKKVLDTILPEYNDQEQTKIYSTVNEFRYKLIEHQGGRLYDGVKEGLELLSTKYKLFIVSNCPRGLIDTFVRWASVDAVISDWMEYGMNRNPKYKNIKALVANHQLKSPIYVGDTDGDREQSELAEVPFVFLTYGFGTTDSYSHKFDDFKSLTTYYMMLK